MSKTVKVNDKGMEVKKPFSFVHLGVDNITPTDVMDSDYTFTYIQGTNNQSAMVPLDNIYDSLYKHELLFNGYLHLTENPNEFEYMTSNQRLAEAVINRAMSAISQNILIIYNNGFKKFISQFTFSPLESESYDYPTSIIAEDLKYIVRWNSIFTARDKFSIKNYIYSNQVIYNDQDEITTNGDDIINNSLDAIGTIVRNISDKYDHIINWYISHDRIDLESCAKYILESDGIDFESVDKSQYIGVVIGVLNQIAKEDLDKIREVVEIELMQATSQYVRDCNIQKSKEVK